MSTSTIKECLAEYEAAEKIYDEKAAELAKLQEVKSAAVKKISEQLRKEKGTRVTKFVWQDVERTIVCRPSKNGEKETWFLRGSKNKELPKF